MLCGDRYSGRDTCVWRYHMEYQHYYNALRRYKSLARRCLPEAEREGLLDCPDSSRGLRQYLNCEQDDDGYYQLDCAKRKCTDCKGNLELMVSARERRAVELVKYQQWSAVPYKCKDGRIIDNHDFLPVEATIDEFLKEFDHFLLDFMPHHENAKWLDNDWSTTWRNISRADEHLADGVEHWWDLPEEGWLDLEVENQVALVIDYANSYSSEHKNEHMQQFWSHSSTTILGCVMKVRQHCMYSTINIECIVLRE